MTKVRSITKYYKIGWIIIINIIMQRLSVVRMTNRTCMHLKHNSWPTPHPSVYCVELLGGNRQPVTGRLATHPSNATFKMQINRLAVQHHSRRPSTRVHRYSQSQQTRLDATKLYVDPPSADRPVDRLLSVIS